MRKRQRWPQESFLPGDGLKGIQEEGNGDRGTTEFQMPPEDRPGWYELQGQAKSELEPSRGAFRKVKG